MALLEPFAELAAGDTGGAAAMAVLDYLKTLSPSAGDLAIRGLADDPTGAALRRALRFFLAAFGTRRDFELVQAYLRLFLTVHGPAVARDARAAEDAAAIAKAQQAAWGQLQDMFQNASCLLSFFSGSDLS